MQACLDEIVPFFETPINPEYAINLTDLVMSGIEQIKPVIRVRKTITPLITLPFQRKLLSENMIDLLLPKSCKAFSTAWFNLGGRVCNDLDAKFQSLWIALLPALLFTLLGKKQFPMNIAVCQG